MPVSLHRLKGEKEACYPAGLRPIRKKKNPPGGEGKTSSTRPGRFSPPGVWRGLSGSAGPAGLEGREDVPQQFPISSLSTTIMVTLWPQASYLGIINGNRRSHVCLWRFGSLPKAELVAALLEDSLRGCGVKLPMQESKSPPVLLLSDLVGCHWQINNWKTNKTTVPTKPPRFY